MADPISVTTTFITLATFIKDLIELGQDIKRSIEKVGENKRRIRDLTEDILRTLANLGNVLDGYKPLSRNLSFLWHSEISRRENMLHVLSVVRTIAPVERISGIRRIRSQFKHWLKREGVEREIQNLKEHINKCYAQFTVFSGARMEFAAHRLQQSILINNVENQIKLRRLESMMAGLLLDTQFGMSVVQRTAEIISSDPTHETLESKYLSAQTMRLVDSLEKLTATHGLKFEISPWDPAETMDIRFLEPAMPIHVLHSVLGMVLQVQDDLAHFSGEAIASDLLKLGSHLSMFGMHSEATAADTVTVKFLRYLAVGENFVGIIPRLAFALSTLSKRYRNQSRHNLALQATQQSLGLCQLLSELSPGVDSRPVLLSALVTHSHNVLAGGQLHDAASTAQNAVILCRPILSEILASNSFVSGFQSVSPEHEWRAVKSCEALFTYAKVLSLSGHHLEAHRTAKEGLQTVTKFAGSIRPPSAKSMNAIFYQLCKMAEAGALSLSILTDTVHLYGKISHIYQQKFTVQFLPVLYAHAHLSHQEDYTTGIGTAPIQPVYIQRQPTMQLMEDDAMQAFYISTSPTEQWSPISPLVYHFFTKHFDVAQGVMRKIVRSLITNPGPASVPRSLSFTVAKISDTLSSVSLPQQTILLEIIRELVAHLRVIVNLTVKEERDHFLYALWWYCWALWSPGCLEEALLISDEAVRCIRSTAEIPPNSAELDDWLLDQASILFDMGRMTEAENVLETLTITDGDIDDPGYSYLFVRSQILRCTGRYEEAFLLLNEAGPMKEITRHIIDADLPAVYLELGRLQGAISCAEQVVAACRGGLEDTHPAGEEEANLILAYALTTLSTCLAAGGRDEEALAAVHEAANLVLPFQTSLINGPTLVRPQEIIAGVWQVFSLRLRTAGQVAEALSSAETATKLYRELVLLAPRHLPTLASSLQNLASVLWDSARREESIVACREAVQITRWVAESEKHSIPSLCDALEQPTTINADEGDKLGASEVVTELAKIWMNNGPERITPQKPVSQDSRDPESVEVTSEERIEIGSVKLKTIPSVGDILWWILLGVLNIAVALIQGKPMLE
ncbi:hypothetical protein B0H11DRAFT_2274708 [Mycena galericulata]|nr:hypothetical protein B0H11DRAFT_2274708 [Mycena galericulata]